MTIPYYKYHVNTRLFPAPFLSNPWVSWLGLLFWRIGFRHQEQLFTKVQQCGRGYIYPESYF